jgi:hypothetical protein
MPTGGRMVVWREQGLMDDFEYSYYLNATLGETMYTIMLHSKGILKGYNRTIKNYL